MWDLGVHLFVRPKASISFGALPLGTRRAAHGSVCCIPLAQLGVGELHQSWEPAPVHPPGSSRTCFGDPNSHEQGSSWGLLCRSPTVLHVMLLSGDKRLCVPKASRPIVLPTSWSLRFWLLRDLFKRALIQHSFVLHSPCLCRVAVPKRGPRGGGKHSTRLGGWQKVQRCSG